MCVSCKSGAQPLTYNRSPLRVRLLQTEEKDKKNINGSLIEQLYRLVAACKGGINVAIKKHGKEADSEHYTPEEFAKENPSKQAGRMAYRRIYAAAKDMAVDATKYFAQGFTGEAGKAAQANAQALSEGYQKIHAEVRTPASAPRHPRRPARRPKLPHLTCARPPRAQHGIQLQDLTKRMGTAESDISELKSDVASIKESRTVTRNREPPTDNEIAQGWPFAEYENYVRGLKVAELRLALARRSLDTVGVKATLVDRMLKADRVPKRTHDEMEASGVASLLQAEEVQQDLQAAALSEEVHELREKLAAEKRARISAEEAAQEAAQAHQAAQEEQASQSS